MAGDLSKGMVIRLNNSPHIVVSAEFYSPAKGGSFTRTKLKNLSNGQIVSRTFRTGEKLEDVDITIKKMQFLYSDASNAYFMNPDNFEQISISLDLIEGKTDYLTTEDKYTVLSDEDIVLTVQLPPKVTLEVTEAEEAVRGNTANTATKLVTCDTGFKVHVPLFIKIGDRIIINTEFGRYVEKASV